MFFMPVCTQQCTLASRTLCINILNFVGGGEQTTEVMNGEVNGQEEKDHDTTTQNGTTEPVNGVQHEDAGNHIK